ncbi:hypothetical protein KAS31_01380 [Candidatus Parcubacteria bacterium]|nr:hypothetical protein [Candidatus Parcubacteria bacterium]
MFDYSTLNNELIAALPEEFKRSVDSKREVDIEMSKTPEFILAKKLDAIKGNFRKNYFHCDMLVLMILDFIKTEGAEEIVKSEEFKEMALIAATRLLLHGDGASDAETLKKLNLMLISVLGTDIGRSESCKKIFLAENSFIGVDKSIISVRDMKEILDIVEEFSISKEEYLLALEICVANKEVKKGACECDLFRWDPLQYTLQVRLFLEIEKKNNTIDSEFDFSEYLDSADIFLKENNISIAAEMYKLLKKAGVSLGEDKDKVLSAYESRYGGDESAAKDTAKKVGLIPYKNLYEKIKKSFTSN